MDKTGMQSSDKVMLHDDNDDKVELEETTKLVFKVNHEAKLKELLHNINSLEVKLCSDATKEFIKLLNGDSGGELLRLYVHNSNGFSELMEAWKLRLGKPGMSYIFSLISVILSHPEGIYIPNDKDRVVTSRVIDKFARMIIDEKIDDIYKELNSKEGKRQNAALLLMASIIRRGSGLASEVAKNFDFKLQVFSKLAGYKQRGSDKNTKHMSRESFVRFAMSFLEVGRPGLLRWVLQQKEMYSTVLRGLGNDEDEIVVYVLSTLKNKVLTEESLVPPGLRSVLFGNITLEQLVSISAWGNGAAELAHYVLVMVCTDPCNGLMPDLKRHPNPLRGNPKRLLGLMKKVKATEISCHRDLLLAILWGRPSLASRYMDEFPYNLEDFASPNWFGIVSLAAKLVSSVGTGLSFDFLDTQSHNQPSFDNPDVQSVLNCICPRPFSRSVINKGLLHSNFLVKHGTLRLLLESLKLLDSFIGALKYRSHCTSQMTQSWASLIQEIQNEVRALLPDPQVLLTLFSLQSSQSRACESHLKRKVESTYLLECSNKDRKKLKAGVLNEDADIIISGINSDPQIVMPKDSESVLDEPVTNQLDAEKDFMNVISEIWGLDLCTASVVTNNADIYFHSKLLDALKIYLRMKPTVLEGSFDFFMNLLSDPLALPTNMQCSLLSLLIEYIEYSTKSGIPVRTPPLMYKHMQPFVNLLIFSPINEIKKQAYKLAQAAMLSTGAFDRNIYEIGVWFLLLAGYSTHHWCTEEQLLAVLQSLSRVVISFLCDAISTIGNNLFKYWAIVEQHAHSKGFKDLSPDFSPLVICVLQKCLRLLSSESGTFSLPEKSMISLYVSNTLKYLLQTQVDAVSLSALIVSILSEGLVGRCSVDDDSGVYLCEWRPLKNLLLFSLSISCQQSCCTFSVDEKDMPADGSFANTLNAVKKFVSGGDSVEIAGIMKAFCSAMLCTTPDQLLKNFPLVLTISQYFFGVPVSILSSIIFLERSFLAGVSKLWPEVFFPGLELAVSMIHCEVREVDPCGIPTHFLSAEEMRCNTDFDATESAAGAFGCLLKQATFHELFPAIMSTSVPYFSKVQDLLLAKLSNLTSDCLISYLRLVLFWFYQIQSSDRIEPMAELQQHSEICLILVKTVFTQLLLLKPDSGCFTNPGFHLSAENIGEVAETVFSHRVVLVSLSVPLSCNEEIGSVNLGHNLESLVSLSQQTVRKMNHHVLDILTTTFDYLLSSCTDQRTILNVKGGVSKPLVKAFNTLAQRLFMELRDKFDLCVATEDVLPLLPKFYALHTLIRFISPFELLELVHWMFRRVNVSQLSICKSCDVPLLSVGLCIAGEAFETLSNYLQQPTTKRVLYDLLWEIEGKTFDAKLIEEIYAEVCKLASNFNLDFADFCLLKAVNTTYCQTYMQQHNHHPLTLAMSKIIVRTPLDMISHCVYRTTPAKAKLLFLFTKMSPVHLSVFGNLFLGILSKDSLLTGNATGTCVYTFSDEEFIMLLPAALSYLNSVFLKFEKRYHKQFFNIPSFYSRMLLISFRHWKSFVSGYIFQEEYNGFFPLSTEELFNFVNDSLLGKTVHMLRYHFALSGDSLKTKKLLKLFNSIFPSSGTHDKLLDCDVNEMKFKSFNESLNLINRVVTKVSLCRTLLFLEDNQIQSVPMKTDGGSKTMSLESGSDELNSSRLWFMNILVGTWQSIVKKLSSVSDVSNSNKSTNCLSLYKYLEGFILRSILELTTKMLDGLIEMRSIPFLEQLTRSVLLYRFEDPTALQMLENIFTLLLEGKFSRVPYLQLLLAHSHLAPAIKSICRSLNTGTGMFLRPMSSILRLLVIPHSNPNATDGENSSETATLYVNQLEIVKLLRLFLQFNPHVCGYSFGKDSGINLRELNLLLLSSYGATMSDIDLEIYNVMHEIMLIDKSDNEIALLDYLWGSGAVKVRKERTLELETSCNMMKDTEAVKERKRNQFRENLPIDPKICAMTVLYFPYDRTADDEPSSSNKLQPDNLRNMFKTHSPDLKDMQRYDPVFILCFAIHSLSEAFIEPVEFTGLGLLAVAFVSISSPDAGIRKLGYETLGRFKNALEKCQKKKDVTRLRLLLTYIQNGIEEPWQRIPSIIAVFAAETSILLLDPSHDHYTTLSKFLMRTSRVNMKCIPLFHDFFLSTSVNFRTERLWILRLVYAGMNLDDDAQIYIKNSILEIVLSFYVSPLSDTESKELILLIVKKSVKVHKMACYLVEHCGLLSWLSTLLSSFSGMLFGNEKSSLLAQLVVVIEVVNYVISSRNITEWLQRHALEQLMEFSFHLYKLLVGGMSLMRENVSLVNSILLILISTLKISQKRKIYQPHFTLSLESLFQIYQAINVYDTARTSEIATLGLKAILMSTPPVDIFRANLGKLSSFLAWAVSTALNSDSGQMYELGECHLHLGNMSDDALSEESLTSKLLRWLIASVILGKLSLKIDDPSSKLSKRSYNTLLSLLEDFEQRCEGINEKRFDCEDILASTIFYLQQFLGMNCRVIPSVISALSILLLWDLSECAVESTSKLGHRTSFALLWSRIHCPAEANLSWRWSYYQPWKDLSSKLTEVQKIDELHACQTFLFMISNVLGKKSFDPQIFSYEDTKISVVFEWERSLIETE